MKKALKIIMFIVAGFAAIAGVAYAIEKTTGDKS